MNEPHGGIVLAEESAAYRTLDRVAGLYRIVFFAGLSAVGKSLMIQQLALIARRRGKVVDSMQWDIARAPFDRPDILARYPERDGVTHAGIRKAVGLWARDAISRWHREHTAGNHLLVGEAPFIGGRLIELARKQNDGAESLLAGNKTLFLIPCPSIEVRRAIVASRRRDMGAPVNQRIALSAGSHLLDAHWTEIDQAAVKLGVGGLPSPTEWSPERYADVYRRVLRHRRSAVLPINQVLPGADAAGDSDAIGDELIPTDTQVSQCIAMVGDESEEQLQSDAESWYLT
jgi:hypothetical protein